MDNLEYIDDYYQHERSPEKTRLFEEKILHDPGFAEDLAFYLSARQAAKESQAAEGGERFREIYQKGKLVKMVPERRFSIRMPYFAAAAMLAAVLLGIFIWYKPTSPQQLARTYISKELQSLDMRMGKEDELQKGSALYNKKKYTEALAIFENLLIVDSLDAHVLENAGKSCLQLGQYDKALQFFIRLEKLQGYANSGKFLEALTLMTRNAGGDAAKAKLLLQQVVDQDLNNKEIAKEWLKKW